ncbi:MAG: hypothetical protein ACRYF3_05030 [Janthinobacterium lividum]
MPDLSTRSGQRLPGRLPAMITAMTTAVSDRLPQRAPDEPPVPRGTSTGENVVRTVLLLLGVSAVGWGVWSVWNSFLRKEWWPIVRWAVGGIIVHDVILAPVALAVGFLVLPRVPRHWRDPLRGAVLAVATFAVLTIPLLVSPSPRYNPTVVPTSAGVSVAVALGVPIAGAVITITIGSLLRRRRARADDGADSAGG